MKVLKVQSLKQETAAAVSHAHRDLNGRVPVHDAASVPGWERGVPEEEPGRPRTQHAVRTHGGQLPPGVHFSHGFLIPLGAPGAFHQRLQRTAGTH